MGHFRTDDDYYPINTDNYAPDNSVDNNVYDNPEMGNFPGGYGTIKKPSIISRILNALGSIGTGVGSGVSKGITLEKVLLALYIIAMVFVAINIKAVLDFLFYATVSILQYLILVLVAVFLIYVFCRFVLHIR